MAASLVPTSPSQQGPTSAPLSFPFPPCAVLPAHPKTKQAGAGQGLEVAYSQLLNLLLDWELSKLGIRRNTKWQGKHLNFFSSVKSHAISEEGGLYVIKYTVVDITGKW